MSAAVSPDFPPSADTTPWALSVVVPACNASGTIESTLRRLLLLPGGAPIEIVVVENGSDDDTWQVLQRVQRGWDESTTLVTTRSHRGLGAAYRAGVAATCGSWVLLTADDLPFGYSDVEAVLACRTLPRFAIGSKAHPRSRVPRSAARRIATGVFRISRRLVLGLDVGDTQGTFIIAGELARELVPQTEIPGFGMTTELVSLADRDGVRLSELPVVLSEQVTPSRIRWLTDSAEMMFSLFRLRRHLARRPPLKAILIPLDPTLPASAAATADGNG